MSTDVTFVARNSEPQQKTQPVIDIITGEAALRQQSELLDRSFNVAPGSHFYDDFPVWGTQSGLSEASLLRVGIFEGSRLVATLSVRLTELKTPQRPLKIALIGAVATEPEYRGKGLASQAVKLAVSWAEERGAALVILWGSEYTLYQRLGFELCGEQLRVPLSELQLGADSLISSDATAGVRATGVNKGWTPGIFEVIKKRSSGLAMAISDLQWLTSHQHVEWYWTGTPAKVEAYAAIGRGIDLQGLVHEWGARHEASSKISNSALQEVLSAVLRNHPDAALLGSPRIIKEAGFGAGSAQLEFLCLARILDPTKVFLSYHPHLPIRAENLAEGWNLTMNGLTIPSLSEGELTRMFFGPGTQNGIFPLPLWIWGLDGA